MQLSKKLKQLRKQNNHTQKQFAQCLGIGHTTYQKYETGMVNPRFELLQKICQQCVNIEPNGQIHACVAKGGEVSNQFGGNVDGKFNNEFGGEISGEISRKFGDGDDNGNLSPDVNNKLSDKDNAKVKGKTKNINAKVKVKNINNIQIPPINKQLTSNRYRLEVAQHNRVRTQCLGCAFWTTCKGGCRVLSNTKIAKHSTECAGFKTFLNYVKEQAAS